MAASSTSVAGREARAGGGRPRATPIAVATITVTIDVALGMICQAIDPARIVSARRTDSRRLSRISLQRSEILFNQVGQTGVIGHVQIGEKRHQHTEELIDVLLHDVDLARDFELRLGAELVT